MERSSNFSMMKPPHFGSRCSNGRHSIIYYVVLSFVLCAFTTFVRAQLPTEFDPFDIAARCPFPCVEDRNEWAHYHDLHELDTCNQTVLLDLNLYNRVDDPTPLLAIRSCAVQGSPSALRPRQLLAPPSGSNVSSTIFDLRNRTTDIDIFRDADGGATDYDGNTVVAAAAALANHLRSEPNGGRTTLFSENGNVIMGVYAGRQIDMQSVSEIIQEVAQRVASSKVKQAAAQVCQEGYLNTQIFGVFLNTEHDLAAVQDAVRAWNDAECIGESWGEKEVWQKAALATIPGSEIEVGPDADDEGSLEKRATCSYTQIVAGDGCWALADRCKITQEQLLQYNNDPNLCSNLRAGKYVCCSAGDLPDFSPQPNSDGTCKTHTVQSGDICSTLAEQNSMTVDLIEERNKQTWGWTGCGYLLVGQVMCLSTGSPPMPAPVTNAVCGPQVPGTEKPADMSTLVDLNPCPLKVCCNVWGQCGITKDFCIAAPADTGAPGTAKPGSNGCIANCGMDIVNNAQAPASFMRIGYFEAFLLDRPCLHMRVSIASAFARYDLLTW